MERPREVPQGRAVEQPHRAPQERGMERPREVPQGRAVEEPRRVPQERSVERPREMPQGREMQRPKGQGAPQRSIEQPAPVKQQSKKMAPTEEELRKAAEEAAKAGKRQ